MVFTQTHTLIGFANPFLRCDTCKLRVVYWHDPDRCGCDLGAYNSPCKHELGTYSVCPTWNPVTNCECEDKEVHDKY